MIKLIKCANPECDNVFDLKRTNGILQKYCSVKCEKKTNAYKQKQKRTNNSTSRICIICGKKFDPNKLKIDGYKTSECCSHECRMKFLNSTIKPRAICLQCSKPINLPIRQYRQNQPAKVMFCSKNCEKKFAKSNKVLEQVHKKVQNDLMKKHVDIVLNYIDEVIR